MKPAYVVAGALVAGALAWAAFKNARTVGANLGGAAVDLADGMIGGAVVGQGGLVGEPETSMTQCQRDMAAGDAWAASFSCPAKDFLSWVFR